MHDDLPRRLTERLNQPLPGRAAQCAFEPEMSFGRHYAPPPADARTAAVIALLYPQAGHWYLPLTVRPHHMSDHAGQVSLPGGMIDPGEESHVAAVRELEEELGIDRSTVQLLGRLSPLYLFVSNFQVIPWVGIATQRPKLQPNPDEVAELLEVPLDHLLDATNTGRHPRQFHGLNFSAPHLLWRTHHIWGATGMILGELLAIIKDALSAECTTAS